MADDASLLARFPRPIRTDHPGLLHDRPSVAAVRFGQVAMIVTALGLIGAGVHTVTRVREQVDAGLITAPDIALVVLVFAIIALMSFSALSYLLIRHGALSRLAEHEPIPRGDLDAHFDVGDQAVTVLVPSYAEEPEVVRATLWSAALQEFPELNVVLLIDDKPFPTDPVALARLERTRDLPLEIETMLREPLAWISAFVEAPPHPGAADPEPATASTVASLYEYSAEWLARRAEEESAGNHADAFFVDRVLLALARDLAEVAETLRQRDPATPLAITESRRLTHRLHRVFNARMSVFERKRYASLSHEANKAMNLNSYLSLMGQSWVVNEVQGGEGAALVLKPTSGPHADLVVPATDYVLTLDADSLLVPEYCLRLVHVMEQPGNERIAVAQTPYSSFRGAPTRVERVAGMTTDLQHLQHQGRTAFDATFWVGANAIIRASALEDIVEVSEIDGPGGIHEVRTYIQDRTVIEDTESSMDLVARGWTLHNHPERLSYSATPPDFGSLVVQRRRWANGGLIILPKIAEVLRRRRARGERSRISEVLVRVDYLGSIAWTTGGMLVLLIVPAADALLSPLLVLTALPYFAAMAWDLRTSGHRASDVLGVVALNLVLLPVNLAGVLKSVEQAIRRRKIPFARTPKVADRVAAPPLFVAVPYVVAFMLLAMAVHAASEERWVGLAFSGAIGLSMLAGSVLFIGVRTAAEDVLAGPRQRFGRNRTRRPLALDRKPAGAGHRVTPHRP